MSDDIHKRRQQRTEAEWDALPPLVKKGENREEVLERLVVAWSTPVEEPNDEDGVPDSDAALKAHPWALADVDLVDANTDPPVPIDLGPLFKAAAERWSSRPDRDDVRRPIIVLDGCRVRACKATEVRIEAHLNANGSRWDDAAFGSASFSGDAFFRSASFSGDAFFGSASFSWYAAFGSASFSGYADFGSASFSGVAAFRSASFSGYAAFGSASFSGDAFFGSASFSGYAAFRSASFSGYAAFGSASFSGPADFGSASFSGYADFGSASFSGNAHFGSAWFSGNAHFGSAWFSGNAHFGSAWFSGNADFGSASFSGDADFGSASFSGNADFVSASFSRALRFTPAKTDGPIDLEGCRFSLDTEFLSSDFLIAEADLGRATIASKHITPCPKLTVRAMYSRAFLSMCWPALWTRLSRRMSRFGWHDTRMFSELRLLTSASYVSLVTIPILAGLWPGVRAGLQAAKAAAAGVTAEIPRVLDLLARADGVPPDDAARAEAVRLAAELVPRLSAFNEALQQTTGAMPFAWFLGFCAAAFVVAGHAVYQLAAPQLVFDRSRADHAKARNDLFRNAPAHEREDMVGRAIEKLFEAAKLQPWTRHPNMVKRYGRAVWVPRGDTEYDQYKELLARRSAPAAAAPSNPGERAEAASKTVVVEAGANSLPEKGASPPPLPHTKDGLDRLLVDEGADAEYAIESRQRLGRAWVAAGFYVAAMLVLGYLVVSQGRQIWREARAKVVVPLSAPADTPPAAHAGDGRGGSSSPPIWGPPRPE